ncbi:MBL fold metallo-hydrolase [Parabacteroides bouchesdurhonensis]|uniref:MBL fold metallo-hydrolase n=1 Tax=Parabacteroides bouchesdurhonensis TaxID=1936995 RepID=UPI000E554A5B|nr:MBL fold metallo-hydrolase [Parabacteroides bouchesdurhonensis]RHJ91405.1 MBL fold metallo-hydrolase [Bacteroides sp. AM07-16]
MKYKVITLLENSVYGRRLQGEHGLSLYIESDKYKLLFDTGASGLFIRNAAELGINLEEVDYLILSHGHSDHTGGLSDFLKINRKASIVCKKEILNPKFKEKRENGIIQNKCFDTSRFLFIDKQTELIPNLFFFPNIEIEDTEDTHFEHFYTKINGAIVPDAFDDELALALIDNHTYSIISACSHRGITNIIRAVQKSFPSYTFNILIGGFHIHNAPNSKFQRIASFLEQNPPNHIGICHCTGIDKYALFCQRFQDHVFYNYTGFAINI